MLKKPLKTALALMVIFLAAGLVAGCGGNAGQDQQQGGSGELSGMLQVNGSTTVAPVAQARAFLDFGFSDEGQAIVEEVGYLPVK